MKKDAQLSANPATRNIYTAEEVYATQAKTYRDDESTKNSLSRPENSQFTKTGLVRKQNPNDLTQVYQPKPRISDNKR